jgi:hypothetical protein
MALSLIVLLVPLAIIVAIFRFSGGEKTVVVDPSSAIAQARAGAAFPVLAPTGLPRGWQTVNASYRHVADGAELRIGFVTSSGGALALIETDERIESVIDRELGERVRPLGPVTLAGRSWQSYAAREGERALVLATPDRTVVVIGRADPAEVEALAAALT